MKPSSDSLSRAFRVPIPGTLAKECRDSWSSLFGAHRREGEGLCCVRDIARGLRKARKVTRCVDSALLADLDTLIDDCDHLVAEMVAEVEA